MTSLCTLYQVAGGSVPNMCSTRVCRTRVVLSCLYPQVSVNRWLYMASYRINRYLALSIGSCRTVALRKDWRATVPPIVKTVYLLRTKSCARFGLNFSIFLLCQVKIPDEKITKHVYLFVKNINKPLIHFFSHCRPEILQQMQSINSLARIKLINVIKSLLVYFAITLV